MTDRKPPEDKSTPFPRPSKPRLRSAAEKAQARKNLFVMNWEEKRERREAAADPYSSASMEELESEIDPSDVKEKVKIWKTRDRAFQVIQDIKYPFARKVASPGFAIGRKELLSARKEKREFLVHRILHRGNYAALGAEYKAGKTWLAIDMALAIITGKAFLGIFPTTVGKVAFMLNEGNLLEFAARLWAVARERGIDLNSRKENDCLNRLLLQSGSSDLSNPQHVEKMYADMKDFEPDLIIIDPWYLSAGEADGQNLAQMGVVLRNVQGVAQGLDAAILITSHWNKTGEGSGFNRWSGIGLQEWARILINVSVGQFDNAKSYEVDKTGKTSAELKLTLKGEVAGEYVVHRTVWRDDADDPNSMMHYQVTASSSELDRKRKGTELSLEDRILDKLIEYPDGIRMHPLEKGMGRGQRGNATIDFKEALAVLDNAGCVEQVGVEHALGPDGRVCRKDVPLWGITQAGRDRLAAAEAANRGNWEQNEAETECE